MCLRRFLCYDDVNSREKRLTLGYRFRWEKMHFNIGLSVSQPINRLILEVDAPYSNSSIGVDNIRLVNCFPGN